MTRRQQQLVRDSFEAVAPMAGPLAKLFYGRLFAVNPSLRAMFRGDIGEQGKKLVSMLESCIGCMERMDQVAPKLRQLGHDHVAYGARPEHYPQVATALLWSLGQALEQQFDGETREAWSALLNDISSEMLAGAALRADTKVLS